jgi:iron complex transport system substrate-binding protein
MRRFHGPHRAKLVPLLLVIVAFAAVACSSGGGSAVDSPTPLASPGGSSAAPTPSVSPSDSLSPEPVFPITVEAANGLVTIAARPEHIVSLSPTATEMLFAIGAGPQVVAVDAFSNYPPEAPVTDLSGVEPNVEAITTYDPDLVVIQYDPGDLIVSLQALDIPVMEEPSAQTLDDAYAQIEQLGDATGNRDAADRVVASMKDEIAAVVASVVQPSVPLTYYHELDDTYFSVTSSTFIGQVYSLLGLRNIADEAEGAANGYPQLSAEYILDANPNLIFLADTKCCGQSADTVAQRPGWDHLTAVAGGAVVELDDDVASRWGPRVVDFLRVVADRVQQLLVTTG